MRDLRNGLVCIIDSSISQTTASVYRRLFHEELHLVLLHLEHLLLLLLQHREHGAHRHIVRVVHLVLENRRECRDCVARNAETLRCHTAHFKRIIHSLSEVETGLATMLLIHGKKIVDIQREKASYVYSKNAQ